MLDSRQFGLPEKRPIRQRIAAEPGQSLGKPWELTEEANPKRSAYLTANFEQRSSFGTPEQEGSTIAGGRSDYPFNGSSQFSTRIAVSSLENRDARAWFGKGSRLCCVRRDDRRSRRIRPGRSLQLGCGISRQGNGSLWPHAGTQPRQAAQPASGWRSVLECASQFRLHRVSTMGLARDRIPTFLPQALAVTACLFS
jgi:hypothetical protein